MVPQDPSQRPYLLRAMHEWMTDTGKTPHVVIDATVSGVQVPGEYIQDGRIILNCSYSAVENLVLGNEAIEFKARFNGTSHLIKVPIDAVVSIIARESGEGMLFADQDAAAGDSQPAISDINDDDGPEPPPAGPGRPSLRIVK